MKTITRRFLTIYLAALLVPGLAAHAEEQPTAGSLLPPPPSASRPEVPHRPSAAPARTPQSDAGQAELSAAAPTIRFDTPLPEQASREGLGQTAPADQATAPTAASTAPNSDRTPDSPHQKQPSRKRLRHAAASNGQTEAQTGYRDDQRLNPGRSAEAPDRRIGPADPATQLSPRQPQPPGQGYERAPPPNSRNIASAERESGSPAREAPQIAGQDHIFYPPDGREFANPHGDWYFGPYGPPPAPGSLSYPPFLPDRPKELGQQKADTTPFPGALPQPFGYYPNPPLRYNPYLAPHAPYPFP